MNLLSDNAVIAVLTPVDIGGTNGSSAAVSMADGDSVTFVVRWYGVDVLDTCKLQICDSNGANGHDLSIAVSAADLITGNTDATYLLECNSSDLVKYNQANAGIQTYCKCYCAEAQNAGTDTMTIVSIKYNLRKHYDNVGGLTLKAVRS